MESEYPKAKSTPKKRKKPANQNTDRIIAPQKQSNANASWVKRIVFLLNCQKCVLAKNTKVKQVITPRSSRSMLIVALIYLIITLVLSRLVGMLEERLHENG